MYKKSKKNILSVWSFVQIEFFRYRYRKIIANIKLQNACSGTTKINVFFVFTQSELWGLQSLYSTLSRSTCFNPSVVVMPNFEDRVSHPEKNYHRNLKNFTELGLSVTAGTDENGRVLSFRELSNNQPCIVFFDQPHPNLPKSWKFSLVSKVALICYVPYGFKVANDYQGHFNQKLHNISWRIFCETSWHFQQFRKFGKARALNVVVSGYPKFDSVQIACDDKRYFGEKVNQISDRKILIWAPHWSVLDSYLGYSTFDKYYDYFLRRRDSDSDVFWVFRPHQRLRYQLVETGFMSEVEVDNYYESWRDSPNSIFSEGSDYLGLFMCSDALITDSGSFLAEYLISRKPVLVLKSAKSVGYNEFGKQIFDSYYHAESVNEIEQFINKTLTAGFDFKASDRLQVLELTRPHKNQSPTEIIYQELCRILKT